MKTRFIVTSSDPDGVTDDETFGGELEHVEVFTTEKKARVVFDSRKKRTNMDIFLLKVEYVAKARGTLV